MLGVLGFQTQALSERLFAAKALLENHDHLLARDRRRNTMTVKSQLSLSLAMMALVLLLCSLPVQARDPRCSRIAELTTEGPYDFRDNSSANAKRIKLVESYHFKPSHRSMALQGSPRIPDAWGNMVFILRIFPNHHQALYHLGMWEIVIRKYNKETVKLLEARPDYSPLRCFFDRAAQFTPDDPNVFNAWARIMHRAGRKKESAQMFARVVQLAPESAQAHYNLGLSYYAQKKYKAAAESARRAYDLGFARPELRNRLKKKGVWK